MTPIYLNSLSNDHYKEHQFLSPTDHHNEIQFPSPKSQASSSSNSLTCNLFFNPTTIQDHDAVFNEELQPSQNEDDNFGSQAYHDDDHVENKDERVRSNDGLKFSLWKRETYDRMNDENQVKWMSSKMRVMLKMKKTNPMKLNTLQLTTTEMKLEEHKEQASSSMEENVNSNSINNAPSNNNIPIRVCSDCNTTKTPLWRSGPQGPKSLCNACGIRQRKARKAMAVAAAAAAETSKNIFIDKPASPKATQILHKDQKKTNNGHTTKHKKRHLAKQINKNPLASSMSPVKKNCVEDLLISLRKNLAFHGVFPQDEKEAAILLMALSCGYVHQ